MITVTENAVKEIQRHMADAKGKALRVYVEKDCCSGMEYGMALDDRKVDDKVQKLDGFEIVVDPKSVDILKDAVIDFVNGPRGTGFEIRSSYVHEGCGCHDTH
jgi:iron-sulfur cluster assembly accessory protein